MLNRAMLLTLIITGLITESHARKASSPSKIVINQIKAKPSTSSTYTQSCSMTSINQKVSDFTMGATCKKADGSNRSTTITAHDNAIINNCDGILTIGSCS